MELLEQNSIYIFSLLGLITFALSVYLGFLLNRLSRQKKLTQQALNFLDDKNQERHDYRIDSIETICLATLQHQCELSEACIRVKKLLEYYPEIASQQQYHVIEKMYEEIRDFDTLEDRQALSKQEKFIQDNKRFEIEAKYSDEMMKGLEKLKSHVSQLKGTKYNQELR